MFPPGQQLQRRARRSQGGRLHLSRAAHLPPRPHPRVRWPAQWVEGEIRGQIQRNEIAIRAQQDIQRLDREIAEHRRRTNSEIQNQMFHNLVGTDEYVNPHTKKTEVGSNAWNYRWVNDRGEAVYTDDPTYDPASAGLQGYVESPVRKRSPAK